MSVERNWRVLVLAAGDGRRLSSMTTDMDGTVWPKQFWSLDGRRSLLDTTLERAERIVPRERISTVVAASHWRWWIEALDASPTENVVIQPANRGTAAGILLPLLTLLARDSDPSLLVLPSDHYVRDEMALAATVRQAMAQCEDGRLTLFGITPENPDPDLGWIVPAGDATEHRAKVESFVEKPPPALASRLLARGALWNSFIFTASGRGLLAFFERRLPYLVERLRRALDADGGRPGCAVAEAYANLSEVDFSRNVLQGSEESLAVVRVPTCGWSDLGTPARVRRVRQRSAAPPRPSRNPRWQMLSAAVL